MKKLNCQCGRPKQPAAIRDAQKPRAPKQRRYVKNKMNIQLLYGDEFWCKFEALLNIAKERVFIASAYLGQNDYRRVIQAIPKGVFYYFATRDENSNYKPNSRCILINKNYFHGKIYLIDNCVIIGSQNLYKPKIIRQGEFSFYLIRIILQVQ